MSPRDRAKAIQNKRQAHILTMVTNATKARKAKAARKNTSK